MNLKNLIMKDIARISTDEIISFMLRDISYILDRIIYPKFSFQRTLQMDPIFWSECVGKFWMIFRIAIWEGFFFWKEYMQSRNFESSTFTLQRNGSENGKWFWSLDFCEKRTQVRLLTSLVQRERERERERKKVEWRKE